VRLVRFVLAGLIMAVGLLVLLALAVAAVVPLAVFAATLKLAVAVAPTEFTGGFRRGFAGALIGRHDVASPWPAREDVPR